MLNYRSLRGTYYYHLNIKEIDHIVFITKMVHVMFHETASRKLLVFTLYVNPYMSNGVSHFNLLDDLITWSDATVVMWRRIWVCTVYKRPTKWRQGLNELNITPRVLEITSRNFWKCKTLEWDCANPDVCPFMETVGWLVGFVALRPKSTAMVIAGRSVHLTTLFPGRAWTSG